MFDKLITNINIYNTKPHHEVYLMPLQQEFWKYIVGLQISNWGLPKFHIFMKSTDWQSSKFNRLAEFHIFMKSTNSIYL
jgi:hypothetical protein